MFDDDEIREPAVAGQFYPANPATLRDQVAQFIERGRAVAAVPGVVQALIAPHAGYRFSGVTAGCAYAGIGDRAGSIKRVVVLAPAHTVGFDRVALAPHNGFDTPLGVQPIDTDACSSLVEQCPAAFMFSERAHALEHSIEVQLPFINHLMPDVKIVPAVCGHLDERTIVAAAEMLAGIWDDSTLLIVSSDFTHYGSSFGFTPFIDNVAANLRALDMGAVEKIKQLDRRAFLDYVNDSGATICGAMPIALLLEAAALADKKLRVELLDYSTSGDVTGDYRHVVSYAALAMFAV